MKSSSGSKQTCRVAVLEDKLFFDDLEFEVVLCWMVMLYIRQYGLSQNLPK